MQLSSPTGPIFSLHRSTSFLRGCNPIEESKQELGSLQDIYCASMGELVRDHDWKSRQPRTYSDISSSYPSFHSNPDSAASSRSAVAAAGAAPTQSPSREQQVKREEQQRSSPLQHRQRKLSWTRTNKDGSMSHQLDIEHSSGEDDHSPVMMRPMSATASTNSERLPGIAHLDEQMHTPWSVENARRSGGFRGYSGDDSLRRLSAQSFAHSGRSWRFSLPDPNSPAGRYESQATTPYSHRRSSSPSRSHFNYHNQSQSTHNNRYTERPSLSPGGSKRSPPDDNRIASYSARTSDDRDYPPRLPSREDRRHQAAFVPYDSRDEPYVHSQDRRREGASDYAQYRYSTQQQQHRDTEMNQMQSSSSYSHHGGSTDQGYSHRLMDRDSPSYYDEVEQQRSEGVNHPYSSPGGVNSSLSVPRRRGKLPKVVTDLLKAWLLDHSSHPYPTEDEKRRLCSVTGLSISQVSNWFINARRRILVPQGSGNFALGQPSTSGASPPPLHHLAPPHNQHHPQYQHPTHFQDDGKHLHMYRNANTAAAPAASRSHSPEPLPPHLQRRSYD